MVLPLNHLKLRTEVLDKALIIEFLLSKFLAKLLDMPNWEQSYSFRNKQGALSLDQKVGMLIDINVLKRTDKDLYKIFMEVRNQFMHNLSASSYEAVIKCIEEKGNTKRNKVLTFCPDDKKKNLSKEEQLHFGFLQLASKVEDTTILIMQDVHKKYIEKSKTQFQRLLLQEITEQITESTIGLIEPVLKVYEDDNKDIPVSTIRELIKVHNESLIKNAEKLARIKSNLNAKIIKF